MEMMSSFYAIRLLAMALGIAVALALPGGSTHAPRMVVLFAVAAGFFLSLMIGPPDRRLAPTLAILLAVAVVPALLAARSFFS